MEKLATSDAVRAIKRAEVVVVLMDATLAFEKQDLQLAELAAKEGRAVVLAVSKWDLVPVNKREEYLETARERADASLPQIRGVPIVPLSATAGKGPRGADGNRVSHPHRLELPHRHRPAQPLAGRRAGPPRPAAGRWPPPENPLHDAAKARPPTFMLSSNLPELPATYERYLVNGMRDTFGLKGVPIRLRVKKGKNPYADKG